MGYSITATCDHNKDKLQLKDGNVSNKGSTAYNHQLSETEDSVHWQPTVASQSAEKNFASVVVLGSGVKAGNKSRYDARS